MLRFSVVAAACVAVANAYPKNLQAPCGEWQADVTPIVGTTTSMGTTVVKSEAGRCVVTVEGLSAGSPYEPSKAYTITVTSTGSIAAILSVKDGCLASDKGTTQLLAGGTEDHNPTEENQCRVTAPGGTSHEFAWTAPTGAYGNVNIKALCGGIGEGVWVSDTVELTGGSGDIGSCPAGPAKPVLTKDPASSCLETGWTVVKTVPSMTICFSTNAGVLGGAEFGVAAADLKTAAAFRMSVTGQYGALGFNDKFKMPGTSYMAVVKSGDSASVNYGTTNERIGTGAAPDRNTKYDAKGLFLASSTTIAAQWVATEIGGVAVQDLLRTTLIFATKAGAPGGTGRHDHDGKGGGKCSGGASCTLDTQLFATTGNLVHGSLMILAWIVCSPVGTMFVRYAKHMGGPVFFKTHRNLQIAAVVVTIIGIIVIGASGVSFGDLEEGSQSKKHAKLGFAVLGLSIFQVLLGWGRKMISGETAESHSDQNWRNRHGENRFIFNWLHKTNGYVLFALGIATCHAGVTVFDKGWVADPAPTLLVAWAIIFAISGVALEVLHFSVSGLDTDADGKFTNMFTGSKTDNAMEKKIRAIVIALLTAFTIATGIALIVVIADTDNTGEFKKFTEN